LPKGRPTLGCGSAGCGRILRAMALGVQGTLKLNEPGVLVAVEETADDLSSNVAALGFDLTARAAAKKTPDRLCLY
jgi:circadian clock protein KaiC